MLSNRSSLTIFFTSAILLLSLTGLFLSTHHNHQLDRFLPPILSKFGTSKSRPPLRVYLTETSKAHDEVVAAFIHSFGSHSSSNISIFQTVPRYGMSDIMANFTLARPVTGPLHPNLFGGPDIPDIVISGTCNFDMNNLRDRFAELQKIGQTYLFCVIHHANWWDKEEMEKRFKPWLDKKLMSFVFLSPHTANFFKEKGLTKWSSGMRKKAQQVVKVLTPVFPVSLPPVPDPNVVHISPQNATITRSSEESNELAFALQGNYESFRRDFNAVFKDIEHLISTSSQSNAVSFAANDNALATLQATKNITLHLLGNGNRPQVPDAVKSSVIFDENLSYKAYYDLLSRTLAVLPAFASDEYLDRKASSSVPAALLGGTPLIATKGLADAYAYLQPARKVRRNGNFGRRSYYLQKDDETELDVMKRILKMSEEERADMKKRVRERCVEIQEENIEIVGRWIRDVRWRLGK